MKERQRAISEMVSEIKTKEMKKDDIIQKIEKLKEEQAKRKTCKLILEKWFTSQYCICDCSIKSLHLFVFLSLSLFSVIESQHKANKNKLRNLQKARLVFQEHLGMEIRTILGKSQAVKGVPNTNMHDGNFLESCLYYPSLFSSVNSN